MLAMLVLSAYRSSSGNPVEFSNMDDKVIMPGETLVIADLAGPGMVAHIWITVAENEFGWPVVLNESRYNHRYGASFSSRRAWIQWGSHHSVGVTKMPSTRMEKCK